MNSLTGSNNPYLTNDLSLAPFVGRQKAIEFLHQQLTSDKCCVILGRRESGKTALLRQFGNYFDDTFTSIYLPHKEMSLQGQSEWLLALAEATLKMLMERSYSLSRLVNLQPATTHMREWFAETFLPEVSKVTRADHLVFLLDDAGALLKAVQDGRMPDDHFDYLHELRKQRPELGLVLALDSRYEDELATMSPLVGQSDTFRLGNLTEEETGLLLRKPVEGEYTISDEAVKVIYRAAGGQPMLLQRFGARLYTRWDTRSENRALSADDVKAVVPQVYNQSEADFQRLWGEIGKNERLTLAAISQLDYADPLAAVDAAAVERWQLESDYPLDITAIHAALRGLEYEDVIEQTPQGIHIVVGLMQTWLLENGRVSEKAPLTTSQGNRFWWAAIVILLVLAIVLALIARLERGTPLPVNMPPTVTLVTNP